MTDNKVVEFIPLLDHDDYEILNEYPFTIRRKDNHYAIKENEKHDGYIRVALNRNSYMKHILIAKQFIPNDDPEHKTQVDHINHNKADYHLSNLRWVTPSQNQRNRSTSSDIIYTYVDEIDEDSITVTDYGNHKFEEYYYDEKTDRFYFWNGMQFRELHINEDNYGLKFVHMMNTNNKKVKIYYTKFKKIYGIN